MNSFDAAKKIYADLGVDVEKAMKRVDDIAVSLHCWQGDDVRGSTMQKYTTRTLRQCGCQQTQHH